MWKNIGVDYNNWFRPQLGRQYFANMIACNALRLEYTRTLRLGGFMLKTRSSICARSFPPSLCQKLLLEIGHLAVSLMMPWCKSLSGKRYAIWISIVDEAKVNLKIWIQIVSRLGRFKLRTRSPISARSFPPWARKLQYPAKDTQFRFQIKTIKTKQKNFRKKNYPFNLDSDCFNWKAELLNMAKRYSKYKNSSHLS